MADDAIVRVGPVATVVRGIRGRCGRCGARHIHTSYFRLAERCPACGYQFAREEGFLTGVFLVNFGVTLGVLWVLLMVVIVHRAATDTTSGVWPIFGLAVVLAVAVPIVVYPRAASTWAALDLAMRPLEPDEEAEAATWQASPDDSGPT